MIEEVLSIVDAHDYELLDLTDIALISVLYNRFLLRSMSGMQNDDECRQVWPLRIKLPFTCILLGQNAANHNRL